MKKIIPIISVIVIIIVIVGSCFLYNYTEVFGKKLIPIKITSANISYIPGVNKDIVDSEGNSIVPLENIKISSKDLKVLSKKVKTIKKT